MTLWQGSGWESGPALPLKLLRRAIRRGVKGLWKTFNKNVYVPAFGRKSRKASDM